MINDDLPWSSEPPKVGLIVDPGNYRSELFIGALRRSGLDYVAIDPHAPGWLEEIKAASVDLFISVIPANVLERHLSYCTRASAIEDYLKIPVYPNRLARSLYENKQAMADFLECNGYPSARTYVFTERRSAIRFAQACRLPIVLKSNFGSGSTGVEIVYSRRRLMTLVKRHFSRIHPYFALGYAKRMPTKRLPFPLPVPGRLQRNFVLMQEYVEARWEWRIIRIGDRYFSHKKLMEGKYASGSLAKSWEVAPDGLFDLVRGLCQHRDFPVMCVDVLETLNGDFVINELQCQFGQSTPHLMMRNGVPGYMSYDGDEWQFHEGVVTANKSADAILEAYLSHFGSAT